MTKRTASLILMFLLAFTAMTLLAQKPKTPKERTISGIVTDAAGNAIPGAVVQLENLKTLQVRSFITKDKGDYIFQNLSMEVDWRLKAQSGGKESAPRTVSTFDSHPELTINFQVK
jgi:hypothetical protein